MGGVRRFALGLGLGFCGAPFFTTTAAVLCESVFDRARNAVAGPGQGSAAHISADGLSNSLFDNDPPPTQEELQYVKTWGVRWVEDWDRPGLRPTQASPGSTAQRQILLVRHGQYLNEGSHDDTIRTLTPLGEAQARATGLYLRRSFEQVSKAQALRQARRRAQKALRAAMAEEKDEEKRIATDKQGSTTNGKKDAALLASLQAALHEAELRESAQGNYLVSPEPRTIFVSDMNRAKQTAQALLEAFPAALRKRLVVDPDLRERFPCDPQPYYRYRSAQPNDMRIAEEVFTRYFHRPLTDESTVDVIVGHGNMIRYLTLRALQLPPEAWLRTTLPHCSITSLTINSKGHVKLVGWGSYGHLAPEMVTVNNIR